MFERIASIAAGFLFSLAAGHWAIRYLIGGTRASTSGSTRASQAPGSAHAEAVGLLERALYTATWQLKAGAFIPVWLLLKVATQWKHGSDTAREGRGGNAGQEQASLVLLEAGASLSFGVSGALITEMLGRNAWAAALTLAVAVTAGILGLGWFASHRQQ